MSLSELFPSELTDNQTFRANVLKLLTIEPEILKRLAPNLPTHPAQLREDAFLKTAASASSLPVKDYQDVAAVARMMIAAAATSKVSPDEIVDYLSDLVGADIESSKKSFLQDFISSQVEDERDTNEVRAFSFGETFAGIEFQQLIIPAGREGKPNYLFGGNLIIEYIDVSASRRGISLNLSLSELKSLVGSLQREVDSLENLRDGMAGKPQ